MAEKIDIEKLREEVNPVYNTAQSCLQIVASTGDEDSEKLRQTLGFSEFGADSGDKSSYIPPEILQALMKALPVMKSLPESRFFSFNNFIEKSGAKQVMDLPCGYTSRGIKLAKSGIRYFGLDLPAVIEAMDSAVKKTIGENENISYHAVDATNYASLRKALEGADGELTITTEGLLMYFTQAELETVFGNIRRLLLEFGGKWVTLDNELGRAEKLGLSAAAQGLPREIAEKIGSIAAGSVAKTTLANNVFFDPDQKKVEKFVSDMGFDLELIPVSSYLPASVKSAQDLPEELKTKLIEAISGIHFWVMTAKSEVTENFERSEDNFKADVRLNDNTLNVSLTGRLDTITSPGLLSLYREAEAKGSIESICVDMKNLEYISSAGLRVILIMRKALKSEKDFSLINMSDEVKKIIETTGFDTIFC